MKSDEYYKSKELERIDKINNAPHFGSELKKQFLDKDGSSKSTLLKQLSTTLDDESRADIFKHYDLSVSEKNLDLLKEFFNITKDNIKLIDSKLKTELRSISDKFLYLIPSKERNDYICNNNFSLEYLDILRVHQLLNKN